MSFSQSSFVKTEANQFVINGENYRFIGANYWYGGLLATDGKKGEERLKRELDFLQSKGVNNLRIAVGAEGFTDYPYRIPGSKTLQPEQGKFDEGIMKGLDYLLVEMGKRNMKAILHFTNTWEWSGGLGQYLEWNGYKDQPLPKKDGYTWDKYQQYISQFFSCDPCKNAVDNYIRYVVNRTNSISGKRYIDETAIMAWEIINEPRPMSQQAVPEFLNWIKHVAALVKSLDKNHLLTTGSEGDIATNNNIGLYETMHADKNIDYLTIHIWPKNWGWFKDTSIAAGFDQVLNNTKAYIDRHIAVRDKLNKPFVIEEFGLPRNGHSFDINAPVTYRDNYYTTIIETINNQTVAGINFWAFGGEARPKPGQIFWKEGDDFMGDPGGEEQGLNVVFDSDSSTWKMITSFTQSPGFSAGNYNDLPVDKKATKETVALYHNLKRLIAKGVMFGHQDALAYGVNWKYEKGRSDIKDVTGDYPAVYGFELGRLEIDEPVNLDSVPFDKMKDFIREAYGRGGVITLSWHLNNPLTGKTSWDPAPGTLASILPNGSKHELYKSWLDKVAIFMLSLKGKNGEFIPVIFRPFHELNGSWFWWGKNHCTPEELQQAWHFTVGYLRDTKNVHNLLYAFNTDRFSSKTEYLERYPGDEWTDIIGFDIYQREKGREANEQFVSDVSQMLTNLESIATASNKIPALTEFGFGTLPDSAWWTNTFLKGIQSHKISYMLAWRNAGHKGGNNYEYYVPFKGHKSAADFRLFYNDKKTLFQKEITVEKMYFSRKPNNKITNSKLQIANSK
ncbi:MAG: glycosyl hydrolase [Bacteroidota bacterium]